MAVHVDNGFMRKSESQEVEESLKRLGLRLRGNCGAIMKSSTQCSLK